MIDKELRKAVWRLFDYYEDAQEHEYIRDKLAWALYQTWKEYDQKNQKKEKEND